MPNSYPLDWPAGWKRQDSESRRPAHFGTRSEQGYGRRLLTLTQAIARLMSEIQLFTRAGHPWRINPDTLVLSTNLELRKSDGMPRSGQPLPDDPGVAVYFELDGRQVVLACDKWLRIEDNIAAIAKTLEAMRGLERWGVSDMLRRAFTGFQALPNPDTPEDWRDVLGCHGVDDIEEIKARWRRLAQQQHPDRHSGDADQFVRINAAYERARQALGIGS